MGRQVAVLPLQRQMKTKKKNYEVPKLDVHGTLLELTKIKGGTHMDGTGKPESFLTGGKA